MTKLERQYQAIPQPTEDPASMLKALKALIANVEVLCGMRPRVPGLADQLVDLKSEVKGAYARYTEYVEVSATKDQALAQRTTSLEVDMRGATGRVTLVEKAAADANSALASRTTTLETDMNGSSGRVSTIEKAYVTADAALAQKIDQVSAEASGGSAGGKIAFVAGAAPSGWSASYDLTLTAKATGGSAAYAGMSIYAKANPDGSTTSGIVLTANTFMLYDQSLGAMPVFAYANNLFTFNVPVQVNAKDIGKRQITMPIFAKNNATAGGGAVGVAVTITDPDTIVDIVCDYGGEPTYTWPRNATSGLIVYRVPADNNAVVVATCPCSAWLAGSGDNTTTQFSYTAILCQDKPGVPGTYTYVFGVTHARGPVTIKATALVR